MVREALEGICVVDTCRYGPGRFSSMLLADCGAEVITIETPRIDKSLPSLLTDDKSCRYIAFNRNKKSMAINLKKDQGRELLYKLIKNADVFIEGHPPGLPRRM